VCLRFHIHPESDAKPKKVLQHGKAKPRHAGLIEQLNKPDLRDFVIEQSPGGPASWCRRK